MPTNPGQPSPRRRGPLRDAALQRAEVWRVPEPADLSANPPDPTGLLSQGASTAGSSHAGPTARRPKFDCVLRNGDVVKVKYGRNPEVHGEAAASRLLTALGFGADSNYLIEHLRCYGCPRFPFQTTMVLGFAGHRRLAGAHGRASVYGFQLGRGRAPLRRASDRRGTTRKAGSGLNFPRMRHQGRAAPSSTRSG